MTFEIVIVAVLSILLWLLLRHWPETEVAAPRQQVNTRKPLEEHEAPVKKQPSGNWWTKFTKAIKQSYNSVLDWYDQWQQHRVKANQPGDVESSNAESTDTMNIVDDSSVKEVKTQSLDTSDSNMMIAKAEVAQRKGDYERAEKLLVKAASLDPKNPKIYSKLGIIYLELGENFDEAEQSFRQALKYDAKNGYVHNNLGLVLYYQDKFSAAAEEFEYSIDQDDQVASRHVNLGLSYSSLRQFAKAETCYKRALKLDPDNEEYQELAKEALRRKKAHQQR